MDSKTFSFNKLIRDKLYDIIRERGAEIKLKNIKNKEELVYYFKLKIQEEAAEVMEAETLNDLTEELADCLEVIHGFSKALGLIFADIEKIRQKKHQERGGFDKHLVADTVTLSKNYKKIEYYYYCLNNPEKYPQVKEDVEG